MNHSFGKAYKLCSKKLIDEVFESGVTVKSYPLIAKYKKVDLKNDAPFQMVISAPKRTFKNAFQRNRIKRLCKEAIRMNKQILEEPLINKKITL
ncbi:MAG: ribonuclease P protein component, partial [Crocinitomicaceae bacterium]